MNQVLVLASVALAVFSSLNSSQSKVLNNIASLANAPNGVYRVEGEAVLNKNQVSVFDPTHTVIGTCSNKAKSCAGAGLLKISKQGSTYTVLNLIKTPTQASLNLIEDVEVVTDSLIRLQVSGQWHEVQINKGNVNAARDLVLNKNLDSWGWDANTQNLIKVK